jgi:hypothetical protein
MPSRATAHDSGSLWLATPSVQWTCTTYSSPVSRRTFDPIFDVTAGAVDRFVQMPGRVRKVRDHEARVIFGLATGMADDFGLDDHAAAPCPSAGGIAALAVQMIAASR